MSKKNKKVIPTEKLSKKDKVSKNSEIIPLSDRVLIKELNQDEKDRKTSSGIIIPDSVHEDKGSKKGKVVAVGEGKYEDGKLVPMKVKIGDIVLFSWGDEIKIDGEEYQIVNESSILAILKS
ncbi:MAG: co-chaperone GroES [Candidatus Paceibacterota bacterium]